MANALHGYARVLARGPDVDWQLAQLREAGVPESSIYCDTLAVFRGEDRRMFGQVTRATKTGDVLVVPCLAIFGRNIAEVFAGMEGLGFYGVALWSVADKIDTRRADPDHIFKLAAAMGWAKKIWNGQRTFRAMRGAMFSDRLGRRCKLTPERETAARTAWLDPDSTKTNTQLAAEWGLSSSRLYMKFGARPQRKRHAGITVYDEFVGPRLPTI